MPAESKKPNLSAVRALVADAEPVRSVRAFAGDPEPGKPLNGVVPGQWTPDNLGLPPDCPVVPLGVDGKTSWYLDTIGQLCAYEKPYSKADTIDLFRGRDGYLKWAWPRWKQNLTVETWDNDAARDALVAAAAAKGPWHAVEKVHGRGAWIGADGGLVLHCGDHLVIGGRREPPGEYDGHVYPTRPPIPRPWPQPIEETQNPAKLLRPLFASWNWARPDVDPHLLLGWIGCAFLGAALPWRSMAFITGDKGSGKSTLQEILKDLLGDWLVSTTNTTAAGIYQRIGQDSLPVGVDEFEGRAENTKAKALIELARQASSGGLMLRGGDRHSGVEFQARSAFIFSSINTPPMEPQDYSRFALLQLHELPRGQAPPDIDPQSLGIIGRCILRRLVDEWPRYRDTLEAYKGELANAGMDGRGQMTFGTLLACADLIEFSGWDEARLKAPVAGDLKPWSEVLAVNTMVEFEGAIANWRACLDHLLSVPVEAWRNGVRTTVGQVVEAWMKDTTSFENDITKVRTILSQAGLGLQRVEREDWLVIPNQNPLTRKLFEGTKWAGDLGSSVWSGALRQAPRGDVHETGQCKVNGVKSRCVLIRLSALYGDGGIMQDETAPVNTSHPDPMMAGK